MKKLIALFVAAFLGLPLLAAGQQFQYGEISPPQPTEAKPGQIDVVEFFWYGCPHCYTGKSFNINRFNNYRSDRRPTLHSARADRATAALD